MIQMPNYRKRKRKPLKTQSQTAGRPSIVQPQGPTIVIDPDLTAAQRDAFIAGDSDLLSLVNPHVAINRARTGRADTGSSWDSKKD
jgi:hypothetical protein